MITGFPGFVARRLLSKYLHSQDDLTVTALILERDREEAERVIAKSAGQTADLQSRVELVVGDVRHMDLGLSGAEFEKITQQTTLVFHLAAVQSVSSEPKVAEQTNVDGTRNVIAFARSCPNLTRLVHFSSVFVSGRRTGIVMEDELDMGQSFRNPYESTKYKAELAAKRAQDDLPVTIFRPTSIVGDSVTGEVDRLDNVYHLGMMLVASPVAFPIPLKGEGQAPLNMIPVDFAVDAVHAILGRADSVGQTYHLVDPNPLSARRVYESILERAGRRLPRIQAPPNLAKALLRIPGLERLAPMSHQAIDYLNHMAFYNAQNAAEALEGTGISCPPFESYVDNLMRYVREQKSR